ncbi:class I SAM-dependent methyltransferase [Roseateles albus]|uniref:Methyltransferase domain-containing protein n=1 Tax=Roseateles albus TaxID=2987525 RepID=A0ABT5KFM7_9BURK|nr:methyltransferase domain-containing protein [Roseateles albus]MDC8772734.1 methyltransferase domain-containing protein [Roseateles albus]
MIGLKFLRELASRVRRRVSGSNQLASSTFDAADIETVRRAYYEQGSMSLEWGPYAHAHMRLPEWFQLGLDPWGEAYMQQQLKLWALIAGTDLPYNPELHEKEADWGTVDPIRQPGFYVRRDPLAVASASDHWIASGMLLKYCGLAFGDWALEYGAGFAQTALALARLGVNVDTVDISPTFCRFVQEQADFFNVPLTAFHAQFGYRPRPEQRYKLIWFYESFHHCLDFSQLVQRLDCLLAPGGRIILGGEPIVEQENAAVPYPWGVRLHSEVAAVVRQQQWMELGFSEPFLYELFARYGFEGKRIECEPSLFGLLYVFTRANENG